MKQCLEARKTLSEALKLPLKIGNIFGILPIKEVERSKFKIEPYYFIATVIAYGVYFSLSFWYLKAYIPRLIQTAGERSTSVVTPACVAILQFSDPFSVSAQLLVLLVKCQDLLAIVNEYGAIEAPQLVVEGLAKKIRRAVAFFTTVTIGTHLTPIIAYVTITKQLEMMTMLPCVAMHCVCDIIFAAYNVVPQVYIEHLNTEIVDCLKTQQLGRIGSLQAKHATAVGWIEDLAHGFGHFSAIRVLVAFLLNLAAFVMIVNGNPFAEVPSTMFFAGMASTVPLAFYKLYIICHYATANVDQVKTTSRLLAKIDTSYCNVEERLQLLGFYSQLSNTMPEITCNGYFSVGKGLLLSFLGHVGTYVVVFLQFNQPQASV